MNEKKDNKAWFFATVKCSLPNNDSIRLNLEFSATDEDKGTLCKTIIQQAKASIKELLDIEPSDNHTLIETINRLW